jgi:uracil-DNA glycosylase family 4
MSFFFTKAKAAKPVTAKPAQAGKASKETLNRLGCKVCPLDKAKNCTPKMPSDLADETAVYFLGDVPNEMDDKKGLPFSGKAGKLLKSILGGTDTCTFDNTVRDFDPAPVGPWWVPMECCRSRVTASIEQAQPKLIVGLGIQPLQWMLSSSDMIGLRGRVFAVQIGKHACWFMPTYHPQFIIDNAFDSSDPLRSKLGHCLKFDLARAVQLANTLPPPQIDTPQSARAGVQAFNGQSRTQLKALLALISEARKAPEKAIDLETTHLRPYAAGAKVLTCALSYGDTNFAFALDHPKAGWSLEELELIKSHLTKLLSDQTKIIAHNCFSGNTEILTDKGIHPLDGLVDKSINVWTEDGWWPATVMKYGKQQITELELVPYNRSRSAIKHTVKTTEGHNWVIERKLWLDKKYRWMRVNDFVKTAELKIGDKIVATAPNIRKPNTYSEGFIHGMIFADGALIKSRIKNGNYPHQIRLCGWKAMFVDRFSKVTYPKSAKGDPVCNWHVSNLNYKELPPEGSSPEYIQDFIEGWQLLDGAKAPGYRSRCLGSIKEEHILWLKKYAALAGWFVTGYTKKIHSSGYSSTQSLKKSPFFWSVTISKDEEMAWTVKTINKTERLEDVYCARVPEIKCFTLSPGIYTGNCPFEIEWFIHLLGKEAIFHDVWECTMMQAHFLDERSGKRGGNDDQFQPNPYQALDFLIRQHFGLAYKALFKLDRKHMASADLDETLLYNGADTKFTLRLYKHQRSLLKQNNLFDAYRDCVSRQPTVALMQSIGIDIDQSQTKAMQVKLGDEIEKIEKKIYAYPEVQNFIKDRKTFNISSQPDILHLLKKYVGAKNLKNEQGKEAVDKGVLAKLDHPIGKDIEEYRNRSKLKSTYVDPFELGKGEFIFPDGKIHPSFNTTFAETGRTSSDEPNQQNWPSRNDKWVRKQVVPAKGHVLVAFDYGQLEACTAAMCTQDEILVKSLWDDYDIHMEWAIKAAKRYPVAINGLENLNDKTVMKKFRSIVKNKLVFPAMFGASNNSVAGYLNMPIEPVNKLMDEFWATFHGLYNWQKRLMNGYYNQGYVQSPTGRRRHYPLTKNQAINYPIQSVACDIVCCAMVKLSVLAADSGWHLHPIMNIHDDLSFSIPNQPEILESAIETIYRTMLTPGYDFINVPLSVTCSVGDNWLSMDEIGKFWSHKDV